MLQYYCSQAKYIAKVNQFSKGLAQDKLKPTTDIEYPNTYSSISWPQMETIVFFILKFYVAYSEVAPLGDTIEKPNHL